MDFKWLGPYRIVKSMGKRLYQIESTSHLNEKIQRTHGIHLKPYNPSAEMVCMPSSPHQAIPESINNANKKRACTDLSSGSIESSVEVRTVI